MRKRPITPERAQRELPRLLALRQRADWRERVATAQRGVLGLTIGLVATGKLLLAKSLLAKLVFAGLLGIVFAFPVVFYSLFAVLMTVVFASMTLAAVFSGGGPTVTGVLWPSWDACDMRTKRRRKLDAMITERQAILTPASRTTQ